MASTNKTFIPLNREQEEAWSEVSRHSAMQLVSSEVLKYMNENFGTAHKHTINLRLLLNDLIKANKKDDLVEQSGLMDVLMERLKQSEQQ